MPRKACKSDKLGNVADMEVVGPYLNIFNADWIVERFTTRTNACIASPLDDRLWRQGRGVIGVQVGTCQENY